MQPAESRGDAAGPGGYGFRKMEVTMPIRKVLILSILLTALIPALSCEGPEKMESPSPSPEEELVVEHLGAPAPEARSAMEATRSYPVFSSVVLEKGYRVRAGDAECFGGKDPVTGEVVFLTMIPCTVPGDDSRVAFIQYFESGEGCFVNAAEYFEWEEYSIPHPLDEEVFARMTDRSGLDKGSKTLLRSESSKRYWGCVTKRFTAGCAGCATACLFSGPGWGACTAKCCAGSAVVALISCAFTVYVGW